VNSQANLERYDSAKKTQTTIQTDRQTYIQTNKQTQTTSDITVDH